jgi:hypothetical protein
MTVTRTIVYDKIDGRIVLVHTYGEGPQVLEGIRIPTMSQLENDAVNLAVRSTGRQQSEFATLHLRAEDMSEGVNYKVDVRKKSLVARKGTPRRKKVEAVRKKSLVAKKGTRTRKR